MVGEARVTESNIKPVNFFGEGLLFGGGFGEAYGFGVMRYGFGGVGSCV